MTKPHKRLTWNDLKSQKIIFNQSWHLNHDFNTIVKKKTSVSVSLLRSLILLQNEQAYT